jgi:hypothetical protein
MREPTRARVTVTSYPLWRIRLSRELPRYLLYALGLWGLAASIRFAVAPPRPPVPVPASAALAPADLAAEGYAVLFARRYLTWNAAAAASSEAALTALLGSGMQANAGLRLPLTGEQRVEWAEVVQQREPTPRAHVYTVAAQTDSAGLVYLTVPVARQSGGSLAVTGYPAFVGAPSFATAAPQQALHEVEDAALATVVERALRNYLAGAMGELEADLAAGARVSPPGLGLSLVSVQRLDWLPDHRSVRALVVAQDRRAAQYTLAYELDVLMAQGRWEIAAVQMDPDS